MAKNLKLIDGTWHWRLTVPKDLQANYPKKELWRSTGTGRKADADVLAMKWSAEKKQEFQDLRRGAKRIPGRVTTATQRLLRDELGSLLDEIKQLEGQDLEGFVAGLDEYADQWGEEVTGHGGGVDPGKLKEIIEQLVAQENLPISQDTDPVQYKELSNKVARAMAQAYAVVRRRAEGEPTAQPWDDLSNRVAIDGALAAEPESVLASGPLASEIWDKYQREHANSWASTTFQDYSVGWALFEDVVGDKPIKSITRDDIRQLRDLAFKLPRHWRTKPDYKDKTAVEVANSNPSGPTLAPATVQRYLQPLKGMLKFAFEEDLVDRNVAAGIPVADPVPASHKRDAWDIERLKVLFDPERFPVYAPGSDRNHKFWIPLLGLLTGARLGELCQLHTEDVIEKDGILLLDIRWRGPENRLKNQGSERVVPLYSQLIRLGFTEYVERMHIAGNTNLWPDLKPSSRSKLSDPVSKWFKRYCQKLEIDNDRTVFHSFRHNVNDALLKAGVPDERVKRIMGHAQTGMTQGVYRKGFDARQLQQDIEALKYDGLDLDRLVDDGG